VTFQWVYRAGEGVLDFEFEDRLPLTMFAE
jgi:hypothetical protein